MIENSRNEELGAQFTEYVLLLMLVAVLVIAGLNLFGKKTADSINNSAATIAAAG